MKRAFILSLLLLPTIASAGLTYTPLVGIPGVDTTDFDAYINSLYILSITIAALLAVIKIIIAGVKWMLTDVVTSKGEAKKDIQGALVGLLIVLAAVLILTVINKNIVNVNFTVGGVGGAVATPTDPTTPPSPTPTNTTLYEYIKVAAADATEFAQDCVAAGHTFTYYVDQARCYKNTLTSESVRIQTLCDPSNTAVCTEAFALFAQDCVEVYGGSSNEVAWDMDGATQLGTASCIVPK